MYSIETFIATIFFFCLLVFFSRVIICFIPQRPYLHDTEYIMNIKMLDKIKQIKADDNENINHKGIDAAEAEIKKQLKEIKARFKTL